MLFFLRFMWVVAFVSATGLLSVIALILFADLKGSWYWKKRGW